MDKTCSVLVDGKPCGRPVNARSMCITHYQRWRKTGTTDAPPEKPRACGHERTPENTLVDKNGKKRCRPCREAYKATFVSQETCSAPGCDRPVLAKGLCRRDYQRMKFSGTTDDPVRLTPEERKQHLRDASNRFNARNRELVRGRARARYWADPERERERRRQYSRDNPEIIAEQNRRWREANPERRAELAREWVRNNPERAREIWADKQGRRRAQMRGSAVGKISFKAILAEYGLNCNICTEPIMPDEKWHWDHVIPLGGGHNGPHVQENIRPAHADCNLTKGARLNADLLR